jgi:hypothetical protein
MARQEGKRRDRGERGASVLAEAPPAVVPRGSDRSRTVPLALLRAQHPLADEGFRAPAAPGVGCVRAERSGRRRSPSRITLSRNSAGRPALGALKACRSLTEAPAGYFTRCPLNPHSYNHNQHAGRPCFSLAVQIERSTSTSHYDISRHRNRSSHVRAHAIHAHADCSPLHRSTTAEPTSVRCNQSARPAMRMTIGRHCMRRPSHDLRSLACRFHFDLHSIAEVQRTSQNFAFAPRPDFKIHAGPSRQLHKRAFRPKFAR